MLREDSQPRRWTRGVWLRLALAFVPIAVVVGLVLILGR
jgi:hypothetical protein